MSLMMTLPRYTSSEKPVFLCCDLQTRFAASPAFSRRDSDDGESGDRRTGFSDCLFVAKRFATAVGIFEKHLAAAAVATGTAADTTTPPEVEVTKQNAEEEKKEEEKKEEEKKEKEINEVKYVVTEQYPSGLGHTVPELLAVLGHDKTGETGTDAPAVIGRVFEKTLFSMCTPEVASYIAESSSSSPVDKHRSSEEKRGSKPKPINLVLFGIETHHCILQTVSDFIALNSASSNDEAGTDEGAAQSPKYHIFVVVDGVCSQRRLDHDTALQTMAKHPQVTLTTSESVLFQLLRDKSNPAFKEISALARMTRP